MLTATKAQDWSTPPAVFAGLHADYGFTIDAAAGPENAKLPAFVTAEMDAFTHDFTGQRVFCNPPFGMIPEFLELARWWTKNGALFWLNIVPANIETKWFLKTAIWGDKHTFQGRVQFVPPPRLDGKKSSASFASCTVMFGVGIQASGLGFSALRCAKTGKLLSP